MGDGRVAIVQDVHLVLVDVDAVRRQHFRVEQPDIFHVRDHGHAEFVQAVLDFQLGLGEVDQQRHVEFARQIDAALERLVGIRIRRVRRDGRRDQRMTAPLFDEARGSKPGFPRSCRHPAREI